MRCENLLNRISLVELNLQVNASTRNHSLDRPLENGSMDDQSVDSTVQRRDRLIVANVAVKLFDLAAGNVRGIGEDQVKRPGIGQAGDRLVEVAWLDGHAIGKIQSFDISTG